ncbi:DNA helicase/exodeoxyribonuclease V, alpha subunit [Pseudidiomarina indica]|uniref:RecBCD enzyme subunit RecD n=1 Tax=Pseudidiomarina indica TaxID=1159017 RepID=A0A1G6DA91_9GAMM|nr:exodeoxyribonuclease V subunit alpha [Pseudidiomarina indica]SDB42093.1 DNA helicase/exodeoxyribonuclease V, alpha subunit [Pseudidiomarina indica]
MLAQLQLWHQHGWIRAIDYSLAQQFVRQLGAGHEAMAVLAALVSHQLGLGHPCLDLQQLYENPAQTLALPPEFASAESLQQCVHPNALLQHLPDLATLPACLAMLTNSPALEGANSPLVVQQQRLYLRRYYTYERCIIEDLEARMARQPQVDTRQLKSVLDELFGASDKLSWQRMACAMAMRSAFTIVTGGPGTGKTYTVVRLLATLQKLREQAAPLRIKLAAPTGKAAARMAESIGRELGDVPGIDEIKQDIPTTATTLHRLLGALPNSRGFRHHARNPLLADVVIIDEASMIDIEMMAAVVAALPQHARLILLGDKDQLASVEAGAVLGQLCWGAEHGHYTPDLAEWLSATSSVPIPADKIDAEGQRWPYLQHTTMFHESRRFDAERGIGKLADEVNAQRLTWLREWVYRSDEIAAQQPEFDNIRLLQVRQPHDHAIQQLIQKGYQPYLELLKQPPPAHDLAAADAWAGQILNQLEQFQVLTAIRQGDWGMHEFNRRVSYWLFGDAASVQNWYQGRAVMVTQNDYSLNLRNGDIGVVLQRGPDEPLRVAFPTAEGGIRWILPSRLTQVDTAFTMTIHKSQGSEFNHTVMVLPQHDVPILTKELLYTGITRAKEQLTVVTASPKLMLSAVERRIERSGGLTRY